MTLTILWDHWPDLKNTNLSRLKYKYINIIFGHIGLKPCVCRKILVFPESQKLDIVDVQKSSKTKLYFFLLSTFAKVLPILPKILLKFLAKNTFQKYTGILENSKKFPSKFVIFAITGHLGYFESVRYIHVSAKYIPKMHSKPS